MGNKSRLAGVAAMTKDWIWAPEIGLCASCSFHLRKAKPRAGTAGSSVIGAAEIENQKKFSADEIWGPLVACWSSEGQP